MARSQRRLQNRSLESQGHGPTNGLKGIKRRESMDYKTGRERCGKTKGNNLEHSLFAHIDYYLANLLQFSEEV